jgi:hypothetical protein
MNENNTFAAWAIVELFGHSQIAGRVTEEAIGGASFIRVDVPEVNGQAAFTKFYGGGAIYSITPVSEEVVRIAVERMRVRPVSTFYLPSPAPIVNKDDFDDEPDGGYG